jgi:hypothetical protein
LQAKYVNYNEVLSLYLFYKIILKKKHDKPSSEIGQDISQYLKYCILDLVDPNIGHFTEGS